MTSETFVTAIFLITAIIAAGVLVNAVFPSIYRASETFVAGSHEMDERMRTDIRIINYMITTDDQTAYIWIKNTGVNPISGGLIPMFDIFLGKKGEIRRLEYDNDLPTPGTWKYTLDAGRDHWGQGETLEIIALMDGTLDEGERVYFVIVLPNGVRRSIDFTATARS